MDRKNYALSAMESACSSCFWRWQHGEGGGFEKAMGQGFGDGWNLKEGGAFSARARDLIKGALYGLSLIA